MWNLHHKKLSFHEINKLGHIYARPKIWSLKCFEHYSCQWHLIFIWLSHKVVCWRVSRCPSGLSWFITNIITIFLPLSFLKLSRCTPILWITCVFFIFKGFCIQAVSGWALLFAFYINNTYYICNSPVTVTMTYAQIHCIISLFYIHVSAWHLVCHIYLDVSE